MQGRRHTRGIANPIRLGLPVVATLLIAVGAQPGAQPLEGGGFTDITAASGLRFTHQNGAKGSFWYPELFGGGVAVIDADSDGWPDLLFINGTDWAPASRPAHALFRNNRNGTFTDISATSGLQTPGTYGLGATVADYDNDGRHDVFITSVDGGRLFRNQGDGRFVDATKQSGIVNREFAVSAAWLDYDRDGLADLYIGNYVKWTPSLEVKCGLGGEAGYCGPDSYAPVAPKLYRNLGGGRFEDATSKAGLDAPNDKAMGVAILDYDSDGWPDIFVGNDRVPARLYRNDTRGGFVDEGVRAGVALSENGAARANMGVDAADYDRSGRPHILVGNFINEMLGLYRNENGRTFVDVAPRSEVGRSSLLSVTWAVFFLDYDLDGYLDLFAANGGTDESQVRDRRARVSQPPLLMKNLANGTFRNVTTTLGADFSRPLMGRGAAYADFDGDGDLDIVITTLAGPAYLFRNDAPGPGRRWLRVLARGSKSTRDGLGAVIRVSSASGAQWHMVRSGSSYASQSELPATFGLGTDPRVDRLTVEWPSGARQQFEDVAANQFVTVDEARGLVVNAPVPPGPAATTPPR